MIHLGRLWTLCVKERRQMVREPSTIVIGVLIPLILLIVFGYGMTMDVRCIRLAIVEQGTSADSSKIIARFRNSKYFQVIVCHSTVEGREAVRKHDADACLFLPNNVSRKLLTENMSAYVVTNASNANSARLHENYIRQVFSEEMASRSKSASGPGVNLKMRMWFNERNESTYYMIPGVMVLITALVGCMLTSLQLAKEYEHGNMESMFATPMSCTEMLLAKMMNNYVLGIVGLAICVLVARFVFGVPMRGSLLILFIGSSIFLCLQMALGLLISSVTKSQFVACQLSLFSSFLPNLMMSGFLWEIPNMPDWLQIVTYLVPGRYYVEFMQSIFLVGNVWPCIIRNMLAMSGLTIVFLVLARLTNAKKVGE